MPASAAAADGGRVGVELRAGPGGFTPCGQLGCGDAVGAALVVDQAARSKFRQGQEARALQVAAARATLTAAGDEGGERQAREVVARQEGLGGEVAVGVEVAGQALGAALQQGELVHRLGVQHAGRVALLLWQVVRIHRAA